MTLLDANQAELVYSENRLVLPMGLRIFTLKRGDRRPNLEAFLRNPQGDPQSLVGLSVTFRMRNRQSRQEIVNAAATVVDLGTALVRYDWQAGETDVAGEFDGWFVVDHGGGELESFPNRDALRIRIEP